MRIAGTIVMLAGVGGALAVPVLGLPGAFPVLFFSALVLWFAGTTTAVACLAPPRKIAGLAALVASLLGWMFVFLHSFAPLWGGLAAVCGMLVIVHGRVGRRDHGDLVSLGPDSPTP